MKRIVTYLLGALFCAISFSAETTPTTDNSFSMKRCLASYQDTQLCNELQILESNASPTAGTREPMVVAQDETTVTAP